MTQIVVLPHAEHCPDGAVIEADPGTSICETLLANDIEIEHACDMVCACTTCHVIVREGANSLMSPMRTRRICSIVLGAYAPNRDFRVRPLSLKPI